MLRVFWLTKTVPNVLVSGYAVIFLRGPFISHTSNISLHIVTEVLDFYLLQYYFLEKSEKSEEPTSRASIYKYSTICNDSYELCTREVQCFC